MDGCKEFKKKNVTVYWRICLVVESSSSNLLLVRACIKVRLCDKLNRLGKLPVKQFMSKADNHWQSYI